MRLRHRSIIVLAIVLGVPAIAVACLWDHDTLRQERSRFPTSLELITGKFLRHSREFYLWRIKDRLDKLAADPSNLAYHDDLAVAYEKTGQHAKAIETILTKEKIKPGLYETYSNLGTFHILAGDFELGLPSIDRALAINSDAHFGRERYQKWLVEYALSQRRNGEFIFPLRSSLDEINSGRSSIRFEDFVREQLGKERLTEEDFQQAVKGVLGMMRFANHDNPLLLEVLGDLLSGNGGMPSVDAKRLGVRAYLKASYDVKDEAGKRGYREFARRALLMQTRDPHTQDPLAVAELEAEFKAELADAEKWYAELRQKEIRWIAEGKDVDAEFDRLYAEEPTTIDGSATAAAAPFQNPMVIGVGLVAGLFAGVFGLRWIRRPSTPEN